MDGSPRTFSLYDIIIQGGSDCYKMSKDLSQLVGNRMFIHYGFSGDDQHDGGCKFSARNRTDIATCKYGWNIHVVFEHCNWNGIECKQGVGEGEGEKTIFLSKRRSRPSGN